MSQNASHIAILMHSDTLDEAQENALRNLVN